MKAIISGCPKFEKLDIEEEKHLSLILNKEKSLKLRKLVIMKVYSLYLLLVTV